MKPHFSGSGRRPPGTPGSLQAQKDAKPGSSRGPACSHGKPASCADPGSLGPGDPGSLGPGHLRLKRKHWVHRGLGDSGGGEMKETDQNRRKWKALEIGGPGATCFKAWHGSKRICCQVIGGHAVFRLSGFDKGKPTHRLTSTSLLSKHASQKGSTHFTNNKVVTKSLKKDPPPRSRHPPASLSENLFGSVKETYKLLGTSGITKKEAPDDSLGSLKVGTWEFLVPTQAKLAFSRGGVLEARLYTTYTSIYIYIYIYKGVVLLPYKLIFMACEHPYIQNPFLKAAMNEMFDPTTARMCCA